MSKTVRSWRMLAALGLLAALAGCGLTPEMINEEVMATRQARHNEWRAARDQGGDPLEPTLHGDLNLDDALKVALQYNKSLQAAVARQEQARGIVMESYSVALPTVTIAADYKRLGKLSDQPMASSLLDQYSGTLSVTQPVAQGGAIPARLRTAKLTSSLYDEDVRSAVQQVIYSVASAYYDAILAGHLYNVYEAAVESAQEHLGVVEKKATYGSALQFDVLRARIDVTNYMTQMIQQKNNIDIARTTLFRLMGVSQDSDVLLTEALVFIPMEPIFERAVEVANLRRPDLFAGELNIRVNTEALKIAQSEYWPALSVFYQQGWSHPTGSAGAQRNHWDRDRWQVGANASWDLFDGFGREGRVKQSRAKLVESIIDMQDRQEAAMEQIRQAMYGIANAEEMVESQLANREMAQEALRLADVGYRAGDKTEVDVTDARSALTTAEGNFYQAIYSHTQARLELQMSMGLLGPQPGDRRVPKELHFKPTRIEEFAGPPREDIPPVPPAPVPDPNKPSPKLPMTPVAARSALEGTPPEVSAASLLDVPVLETVAVDDGAIVSLVLAETAPVVEAAQTGLQRAEVDAALAPVATR